MTVSTQGIELKTGSRAWRAFVELLSSMRFAISLLTVICIASVIGTVLKQHEPFSNYVNQFGPFWAEVFAAVSLYSVYSAWWFLLILGFLVVSTSLCIARNTPKILTDLRSYKENIRVQSLQAFGHRAHAALDDAPEAAAHRLGQLLVGGGWKVRLQQRETPDGAGHGDIGFMAILLEEHPLQHLSPGKTINRPQRRAFRQVTQDRIGLWQGAAIIQHQQRHLTRRIQRQILRSVGRSLSGICFLPAIRQAQLSQQ